MLLKGLAVLAIVLFAVLQGWSNSAVSERCIGVFFIALFGAGAVWGTRTLFGVHR